MIAHLRGTIHRHASGNVSVDVHGVGYRVAVPSNVWDELQEGKEAFLYISPYIREDRMDLFGFLHDHDRILFEKFIDLNGIGPRHGLELSAVPKSLLMQAIGSGDSSLLSQVKGIGKKTAERLLIDLTSLAEKQPELFGSGTETANTSHHFDNDAIEALKSLGYDSATVLHALQHLDEHTMTTEERVAAALRTL